MTSIPVTSVRRFLDIRHRAEEALADFPMEQRSKNCHATSIHIVASGVFGPEARVARGTHHAVVGQHSWVVIPGITRNERVPLVYDIHATVIDATLWSYDRHYDVIAVVENVLITWLPHGWGNIWDYGPPRRMEVDSTDYSPRLEGLSEEAADFLRRIGPLDVFGWMRLFSSPMMGWPSQEIITAAAQDPVLRPLIPIDIVGMLTDLNPGGLYLMDKTPHGGADREEPS